MENALGRTKFCLCVPTGAFKLDKSSRCVIDGKVFQSGKSFFVIVFPPTSTSFLTRKKKKSSERQTNFSCLHENGKSDEK